ncbi:hypothetical protein PUR57_01715, partial [Streptomyces sp. JV176]|uniref:hypothetical protein n=1 Tax=Streptomyces sp. JV176 TaxID=858630 RepID=UPI002E776EB2
QGESMNGHAPPERSGHRRYDTATRRAGQLLCWTHGLAMILTATEALAHPSPAWWPSLWPTAWALTGLWLLLWAGLRVARKRAVGRTTQETGETDTTKTVTSSL